MLIHLVIHRVACGANRVFDRQWIGAAVSNDRDAVQTDQRSTAILGIIQPAVGLL